MIGSCFFWFVLGCTDSSSSRDDSRSPEPSVNTISNILFPHAQQHWGMPKAAKDYAFPPEDEEDWIEISKDEFLALYGHTHHPEYSGQLVILPKAGHYVVNSRSGSGDSRKRAFHLSPFARESRIPLLAYSPSFLGGEVREEPAVLRQVGATIFDLVQAPRPKELKTPGLNITIDKPPKAVITLVFDALPYRYWDGYLSKLPHFSRLRAQSIEWKNTWLGQMPSNTTPSHASIGSGQPPALTGIPLNRSRMKKVRDKKVFQGHNPSRLLVPSAADIHDKHQQNKAVVASFCTQSRAAIAMAGHGSSFAGGDKDIVAWQREHTGRLESNEDFFAFPAYLQEYDPYIYMEALNGGTFLQHSIDNEYDLFTSPHNALLGEKVVTAILENEGFGEDDITDLLFFNQKLLDNLGHRWGIDTPEYRVGMHTLDDFIGRFVGTLNQRFGQDYILFLTADHGFGPTMERGDPRRHGKRQLLQQINQYAGDEVAVDFLDNNVYLNEQLLQSTAKDKASLCSFLTAQDWIHSCITNDEILTRRDK